MAIEDDVLALQTSDTQQDGRLDALEQSDASKENRISVLEQFLNSATSRLDTLEQDRRALKKDYPYKALHLPFYTADDEVALEDYANVSIPTDYGILYLKADADYEFNGYTITLELGAAINLAIRDSTGVEVVSSTAFTGPGVFLLKRINNTWKVTQIGNVFVSS